MSALTGYFLNFFIFLISGMYRASFDPTEVVPMADLRGLSGLLPDTSHRHCLWHRAIPEARIRFGVRTERHP